VVSRVVSRALQEPIFDPVQMIDWLLSVAEDLLYGHDITCKKGWEGENRLENWDNGAGSEFYK
jgi:hypothetical protein